MTDDLKTDLLRMLGALGVTTRTAPVPAGADGEPMQFAEAVGYEAPLDVATKALTTDGWSHMREDARQYLRVSTKAAENHDGVMLALVPSQPDLDRLAIGNEERAELHVTLYYLGKQAEIDGDVLRLAMLLAHVAARSPIVCRVAGKATFNPTGDNPAHVLVLNSPNLEAVHRDAAACVAATFTDTVDQHEPWIPHLTVSYGDEPEWNEDVVGGEITLSTLRLTWDGVSHDLALISPDRDEMTGSMPA